MLLYICLLQPLTCRAGIKATGKLSWEAFLEKFQNPQNNYNGQTIPIKPGHKWVSYYLNTELCYIKKKQMVISDDTKNNNEDKLIETTRQIIFLSAPVVLFTLLK